MNEHEASDSLEADQARVSRLDELRAELLTWEREELEGAHRRVFRQEAPLTMRTRQTITAILARRGAALHAREAQF